MSVPLVEVEWRLREPPLSACGLGAFGAAARALGERLLRDATLADLRAVAGEDLLLIEGADLPWVDGGCYLGRDEREPRILIPTVLAPSIPIAILARALRRRTNSARFALFPADPRAAGSPARATLVPLDGARPIDRSRLEEWLR
jgi:hypothetical protein